MAEFDFDDCRDKLQRATRIILDAEAAFAKAVEASAETEAFYRVQLAERFLAHREAGAAVEAANTLARGECAAHSLQRDKAAGMLKLAGEKLEDARDSRRSLWRLVEWARARDLATQQGQAGRDEREPAERWP